MTYSRAFTRWSIKRQRSVRATVQRQTRREAGTQSSGALHGRLTRGEQAELPPDGGKPRRLAETHVQEETPNAAEAFPADQLGAEGLHAHRASGCHPDH